MMINSLEQAMALLPGLWRENLPGSPPISSANCYPDRYFEQLVELGRVEEATSFARTIVEPQRRSRVLALLSAALRRAEQGEQAALLLVEAIAVARTIEDDRAGGLTLVLIANLLMDQGLLAHSRSVLAEALERELELEERGIMSADLSAELAVALSRTGERAQASRLLNRLAGALRGADDFSTPRRLAQARAMIELKVGS